MPAAVQTEDPRLAIGANDPPAEAKLSIADLVAQSPAIVLTDEQKRAELFAKIEADIAEFEPDLETAKGRDAIKSFAFGITKTKTAIDSAGKEMNEAARAQINVVDAARRIAREKLDALADQARAPLTEWEQAALARNKRADDLIDRLRALAVVTAFDTSTEIRKQGTEAFEMVLSADELGDRLDDVQRAKDEAVASLKDSLARLVREEADRAELERLRAEAAERDARELAEREAREAKEREAAEANAAEERQAAAEKAEAERLEKARQEAADAARREAEEAAQREREEAERAKQAEIDAANERARQAEEDARRQREEAERAQREREEAAQREAAEQKRRDEDRAHRGKIMAAAKEAIMSHGPDEETAKKIVLAIVAGEIPNVTLRF